MKECLKCGYTEVYWRPTFVDIQRDVIRAEELIQEDFDLYLTLISKGFKPGVFVIEGAYAYHWTRTGKWIQRLWLNEFKARGNTFKKLQIYDGGKKSNRLSSSLRGAGMLG